jgi:hypothetical protein
VSAVNGPTVNRIATICMAYIQTISVPSRSPCNLWSAKQGPAELRGLLFQAVIVVRSDNQRQPVSTNLSRTNRSVLSPLLEQRIQLLRSSIFTRVVNRSSLRALKAKKPISVNSRPHQIAKVAGAVEDFSAVLDQIAGISRGAGVRQPPVFG